MIDQDFEIPSSFDPFADAEDFSTAGSASRDYVHIRIQQRNGKKCVTTVQGLGGDFRYNKTLKEIKKVLCCNGNVVEDKSLGRILQLQGDQRMKIMNFLVKANLVGKERVKIHGF